MIFSQKKNIFQNFNLAKRNSSNFSSVKFIIIDRIFHLFTSRDFLL